MQAELISIPSGPQQAPTMMADISLTPSDVADLLAGPIGPLCDGTKLVADFSLDADLFSSQEDDCAPSALLDSPVALHLSPPAVDARPRAPSAEIKLEPFTSSFEAELDALVAQRQQQEVAVAMELEHPAKRLKLNNLGAPSSCTTSSAEAYHGLAGAAADWQGVEVRQLSRRPTSAGLQSFITQLSGSMPLLPVAAITTVMPAAMPAMASPCGPLIPESELMPSRFSQPSSPHKSAVGHVVRTATTCASPNKPATPHKAPLRSPFVTRPTRLGLEAPDTAAAPIAQLAGPIEGKPLSEAEAIRLAAAALQMCGTPNAAIAFLRQLGNSAVASTTVAY